MKAINFFIPEYWMLSYYLAKGRRVTKRLEKLKRMCSSGKIDDESAEKALRAMVERRLAIDEKAEKWQDKWARKTLTPENYNKWKSNR